ncbi:MAG: RNA-splicing ligase RtcB, partial [Spirochaetales bacterium]
NSHVRIMPDCHAGAGCVIGYTARLNDTVIPNLIGVDIGCGVCTWNLGSLPVNKDLFENLDRFIRHSIPSGFKTRNRVFPRLEERMETDGAPKKVFSSFGDFEKRITAVTGKINLEADRVWNSLGTLGGGNHFIELDIDDGRQVWLTLHSGSRNFGLQVAAFHQKLAKSAGQEGCPKGLEYLSGSAADEYMKDMETAQFYARLNRNCMGHEIITGFFNLPFDKLMRVESVHNYINFEDNIIRKGAISAHREEAVIIPLNMAEGCILGTGRGTEDWNESAPHGAGRSMSRSKARQNIPLAEYRNIMKNHKVWSSCIGKDTLDEAPQAYKRTKEIIDALKPCVKIEAFLKPLYNFKASG